MNDYISKAYGEAIDRWAKAQAAREKALEAYNKAVLRCAQADLEIDTLTEFLPKEDKEPK